MLNIFKIKKNEIVVYIGETYVEEIIFEKQYIIDEILVFSGAIMIRDESNEINIYHIRNFITLDEFKIKQRYKKIHKLIND